MIARASRPCRRALAAITAGLLAAAPGARADEPLFGYVNTTDLLPKARFQVEQWITAREGSGAGRFHALEGRTELDYGLADNAQVTAYLNYSRLRDELSPAEAQAAAATATRLARSRVDGVTGEVIWRLASPYLHPLGLAVLADATFGRDRPVFGLKAIGQKNFFDDTLVVSANARVELGQRETLPARLGQPARSRTVTRAELSLGASYRFRPRWSAAVEARSRYRNAGGGLRDSAVYLGPTVHYAAERWYLTLTALARVASHHRHPGPGELVGGQTYLAERTALDGLRLRIGRTF